ncbi:MAG: molybdopterin-dependent oxidoreductase, partial [Gammaproteobacteria bacterium]|nr:molybdopterin-dependent oxidoreductase [Gammaproteobacteria bacterium]
MKKERINVSRREFLISSGKLGVGFSLGLYLPLTGCEQKKPVAEAVSEAVQAPVTPPPAVALTPVPAKEVNAWVVIQPDDTVVIRIARSEMGQGTLTGLAQMVAEELECDWSKVTTEYPTPGENHKRDQVWRNFSTGGSLGIRESHLYVRTGGAVAREMLVQAAADEWDVPREECTVANSVITHVPTGRTTTYG